MSETCRTLGASVALIVTSELGRRVLAVQRTNDPDIAYAGQWEFPGGGADPGESPEDCAIREFFEETGITLTKGMFVWRALYNSVRTPGARNGFFVAEVAERDLPPLQFSDEAQAGGLLTPAEFCMSTAVIPDHVDHYVDYLRGVHGVDLPMSREDMILAA